MFSFGKTSPNARSSNQTGIVYLRTPECENPVGFDCYVTRITPTGIRLALGTTVPASVAQIYAMNRAVEIALRLPGTRGMVKAHGALVCLALNFIRSHAPVVLDLEFVDLTEEEERELRDSNPGLVVA
ncbi:MAG TPA: hypothetical protein PKH51_09310 [Candidatus Sumerlaeota bacterium]|nr:hypothetical protein [Candidatus Sumerlaeota bacterium]HNM47201.1 hypothetical protein [Candidatus Sumerlaeota bacterium]